MTIIIGKKNKKFSNRFNTLILRDLNSIFQVYSIVKSSIFRCACAIYFMENTKIKVITFIDHAKKIFLRINYY